MFLRAYHFDGDPADLVPAYERFNALFPAEVFTLHTCVITDAGLTVLDTCPTQEIAETFSASPQFTRSLEAAGLPVPRTEGIGTIHLALVDGEAVVRP